MLAMMFENRFQTHSQASMLPRPLTLTISVFIALTGPKGLQALTFTQEQMAQLRLFPLQLLERAAIPVRFRTRHGKEFRITRTLYSPP